MLQIDNIIPIKDKVYKLEIKCAPYPQILKDVEKLRVFNISKTSNLIIAEYDKGLIRLFHSLQLFSFKYPYIDIRVS